MDKSPKAELTYLDVVEISESMNKEIDPKQSQGYLEYLLTKFIKERTGVDFFEYQRTLVGTVEENFEIKTT